MMEECGIGERAVMTCNCEGVTSHWLSCINPATGQMTYDRQTDRQTDGEKERD